MDSFRTIFLVAGIGMFMLAWVASGILPVLTLSELEYTTIEQIAEDPIPEWRDLAERWPDAFKQAWGEEAWLQALSLPKRLDEHADPSTIAATRDAYGQALDRGRDIYIAEGCWHCHSQFVRGVSKEEQRWGRVAMADEYQNELNMPQLWGTRRVGPDLSRSWGRHTNDWHAAHFYAPRSTSPDSVMPSYPWYFEINAEYQPEDELRTAAEQIENISERNAFLRERLTATPIIPNRDGFALITYIQWLGSWRPEKPWEDL